MPRLRRADPAKPGWTRRRCGRGFAYLDQHGERLDASQTQRCRDLVIPPAWTDVWICPWPNGHIQAVGTDEAGRRQYLYHPDWRAARDREKFDHIVEFGLSLPAARTIVEQHLQLPGMPFERALATGFRLLDLGGLRVGSEDYAQDNGSYGLATLRCDHVSTRGGTVRLRFTGKSGKEHDVVLDDAQLLAAVRDLRVRRRCEELLAYKSGRRWCDVTSQDVNRYLSDVGVVGTAKDFRTWQAGLRALASLSAADPQASGQRAVRQAIEDVAEHLGNTPAIARSSYVDPRLVEAFLDGHDLPEVASESLENWEPALLELLS
jgi:DNA topoisomerase IB